MSNDIQRVEPPALPLAKDNYDRIHQNLFSNVLRLFFNRVVATVNSLLSTDDGGKFLYMPRGLFYSTTAQTAAATNTGYAVEFENVYLSNGVSIVNDTDITVSADGVYNFQVTILTEQSSAAAETVWTWISVNGVDITYGGSKTTVRGVGDTPVYWNFSLNLAAGDYLTMYWAVSSTNVSLHTEAATTPHPGIPSTIVAVSFVSNN
jgi:hypothetical protein